MTKFETTTNPFFRQAEAMIHGVAITITQPKGQSASVRFGHPLAGRTPQQIRDISQAMLTASDLCTNWNREKGFDDNAY